MNDTLKILFFGISNRESIWEYDYIHNEFFSDWDNTNDYFLTLSEVKQINSKFDVIVYFCRDPNNYPWGYIPTYEHILECVQITNPKIVIQLSDEFIHENLQEHNKLANYCDLFLRQYNHKNYFYEKNTTHIPIGYRNNFNTKEKCIKKIKDRKYNWSFFGTYKSDRKELVDIFSNISNGKYILRDESCSYLISSDELVDFFVDSIFIPCSRGWSTLDTMRLYESSICGAIPIVVGTKEEIEFVFKYEENPPWLFFESWEDACKECLNLLEDKEKLQEIQDKVLLWWENRIFTIKQNIKKHFINSYEQNKLKNFPPVNFISIEESEDRRKVLCENFKKYEITRITPHIYKKYNDDYHKIVGRDVDNMIPKHHRGPVTSHLKAIKEWYESTDEDYAFFCEDDLSFESIKYWNFTWEEFFNRLPKNWQCVQLSFITTQLPYIEYVIKQYNNLFRYRDWGDWSCCSYLIKRSHAKNIVNNYFNGDKIILEYKGHDWEKRLQSHKSWSIPCSETMVCTYFYEDTIYIMPLFLESIDFSSTWSDDKYDSRDSVHNFSHHIILNWWKNTGKYLTIDQIFESK